MFPLLSTLSKLQQHTNVLSVAFVLACPATCSSCSSIHKCTLCEDGYFGEKCEEGNCFLENMQTKIDM